MNKLRKSLSGKEQFHSSSLLLDFKSCKHINQTRPLSSKLKIKFKRRVVHHLCTWKKLLIYKIRTQTAPSNSLLQLSVDTGGTQLRGVFADSKSQWKQSPRGITKINCCPSRAQTTQKVVPFFLNTAGRSTQHSLAWQALFLAVEMSDYKIATSEGIEN